MQDLVALFKGHFGKFSVKNNDNWAEHTAQSKCRSKSVPWSDVQLSCGGIYAPDYDSIRDPIWLDGKPGDLVHLSTESRKDALLDIPD